MPIGGIFRRISTVGWGLVVGLVATVVCAFFFLWVMKAHGGDPTIVELQFAGSSERATRQLTGSGGQIDSQAVRGLLSSIDRDWWFIASYVATLAWWGLYGERHFRMRYARGLGRLMAYAALLAGVADAVENIWLEQLLYDRGANDAAAVWATAMAIPKWLLVACAAPVALAALLTGLGRAFRLLVRTKLPRLPVLGTRSLPSFDGEPRRAWTRAEEARRFDWNAAVDPAVAKAGAEGKGAAAVDREPRVGVCFSGGGIRSATFNMGVLQVLSTAPAPAALRGDKGSSVLQRTDFLSCVSGGAYIGGALQILGHQTKPREDPPTFQPGSPEEHHLRLHGRYIAANAGELFMAAVRVVSGTLLNLFVFTLVLFVLARPLGWLQRSLLFDVQGSDVEQALRTTDAMWYAAAWPAAIGLLVLLGGTLVGGVEGSVRSRVQTTAFGLLALALAVLLAVWLLPTLARVVPHWIGDLVDLLPGADSDPVEGGATALVVAGGGSLTASAFAIINRPAPPPETAKAVKWPALKTVRKWAGLALPYLAGVLLAVIALVAYATFVGQAARSGWDGSFFGLGRKLELWVWLSAAALLTLLYVGADQTRWSLAPFYKRRLSSAFAIQLCGKKKTRATELPWSIPTTLSEFARPHPKLPEVLICAAANLSEQDAAPPGRHAGSFVFGAEVVGGPEVGWARTKDFEAACSGALRSDCSFLSAMAISGAAFASAMGRHSKGAINSLLAASNARLGVWLPNPRYIAELRGLTPEPQYDEPEKPYGGPWVRRRRFSYLFKELFGTYSLQDRFLYLSDGGHYENLGLVELLRRKCKVILCFDASGDDLITCGTFVEAVALAEEELGAEVDIDLSPLAPRKASQPTNGVLNALDGRLSERSVVSGTIRYRDGTPGRLILAKASLTRESPAVVLAHAARQKKATFPNDSTSDQFFDESQFNAYAKLGRHIARKATEELEEPAPAEAAKPSARLGSKDYIDISSGTAS